MPTQRQQPWLPSQEATQELEAIAKQLPFGSQEFVAKVIGEKTTYQVVNQIDDKKFFRTVLNEYKAVMQAAGFQSSKQLEIFAVTSEKRTYILPSYNKLDARQQALILVHEALMREGWSLKSVLQFDGALLDYLANKSNPDFDRFMFMGLLNDFYDQSMTNGLLWFALQQLENRTQRFMTLADFKDGFHGEVSYSQFERWIISGVGGRFPVTPLALIKGNTLSPNFSKVFSSAVFNLRSTTVLQKDVSNVCQQVVGKTELSAMPIVRWSDGNTYVVACNLKKGQDEYIAAQLYIENISTSQGGL